MSLLRDAYLKMVAYRHYYIVWEIIFYPTKPCPLLQEQKDNSKSRAVLKHSSTFELLLKDAI